jgi:very-short-patch-repair endonuclease
VAQQLRRELTPAERVLWEALRSRQVGGLRFRRQHAVGPFVLDFYCPAARLIIEVDGSVHDQQAEQDAARTEHLEAYGLRVLRFRNEEVLDNLPVILARIEQAGVAVSTEHRFRQGTRTTLQKPEAPKAPSRSSPPNTGGM